MATGNISTDDVSRNARGGHQLGLLNQWLMAESVDMGGTA